MPGTAFPIARASQFFRFFRGPRKKRPTPFFAVFWPNTQGAIFSIFPGFGAGSPGCDRARRPVVGRGETRCGIQGRRSGDRAEDGTQVTGGHGHHGQPHAERITRYRLGGLVAGVPGLVGRDHAPGARPPPGQVGAPARPLRPAHRGAERFAPFFGRKRTGP